MEAYPEEAIKNNVTGTRTLMDAASRHGADRLVMLSTDKAVQAPRRHGRVEETGGADHDRARRARGAPPRSSSPCASETSSGAAAASCRCSRQQMRQGGPVTVTHPDVTRYFMTIREAAMLVLEAGFLASGGEIFVLDMGDPIRIAELAEHLIQALRDGARQGYCNRVHGPASGREAPRGAVVLGRGRSGRDRDTRRSGRSLGKRAAAQTAAPSLTNALEKIADVGDREGIMRELCEHLPGHVG